MGKVTKLREENVNGRRGMEADEMWVKKSRELIGKNRKMAKELKDIRQTLADLVNSQNFNHIEVEEKLKDQIEIARGTIERLSSENILLRQALKTEQRTKQRKNSEVIVLEEELKVIEREMEHCEDTRYSLSVDIQTLQSNIRKLTHKLAQSEQLYLALFKKTECFFSNKCILLIAYLIKPR
eukprot:TRINITY_DN6885_c0_g1_i7.p1 TRINITY_DN6885_c0_g1~~TRINITY_DN6885_c0_g1_i7.p1  ORF type:complete len:182 (-),score=30.11 TRINITY_DN6885_c0_g1_i7:159-704(-)